MAYVAKIFTGIGPEKSLTTKSAPGSKETATEWVEIMSKVLTARGFDNSLYCFKIEEV